VGNNEAVAAAIAEAGYPANVLADDSSFPELFELLREQRESWGVHVIPWRNIRELFAVLRRKEILALLVDWGYRPDGVPVRLFGSWTTLPRGPRRSPQRRARSSRRSRSGARRRARSGSRATRSSRCRPRDRRTSSARPSGSPTSSRRPSGPRPEQWYSFKPMWPDTDEEAGELEGRAAAMLDDRPLAEPAGACRRCARAVERCPLVLRALRGGRPGGGRS
jgi:hypothetical protein